LNQYLFGTGKLRELAPPAQRINNMVGLIACAYILVSIFMYPESILYRSICFGLFFFNIFIAYSSPGTKNTGRVPAYDVLLALLSLSVSLYIALNLERYILREMYLSEVTPWDLVFAALTVVLVTEGSRRILGPWLPILNILALLYIFTGQYIPGRFGHQGFKVSYVAEGLFMSPYGVWGSILGVAVGQVIVFLIFGVFLLKSGAGDFFFDFAALVAGKTRGGIAKIAVITSALFGMISGGPASNVATTGSLTIPAMKEKGYPAEFAAAVESCASIGGTFLPPVMGSMVFVMADVVGISYNEVARRAFLPAVLYYLAIYLIVQFRSQTLHLEGIALQDSKSLWKVMEGGLLFLVPLSYLTWRLLSGVNPPRVAIESLMIIFLMQFLRDRKGLPAAEYGKGALKAFNRGRTIVATMASCGILVGVITYTGVTAKFSSFMMQLSNYSSLMALLAAMLITVFLGLAMNGVSSYLITAVICAPALIKTGFEPLGIHLFIIYFAAMSSITPPVAITSFMAASIADANPMKVSFLAMKLGFVAFIMPFSFVFHPQLLLYGSVWEIVPLVGLAIIGIASIALSIEGWWIDYKLNLPMRWIMVLLGGALIMRGVDMVSSVIAGALLLGFLFLLRLCKYEKRAGSVVGEEND
jgi:TRAP transporter 4TM/12TM fusion protein